MSEPIAANPAPRAELTDWLTPLYGAQRAADCVDGAATAAVRHGLPIVSNTPIDAAFNVLITYGDIVQRPGEAPLATLRSFMAARLGHAITAVHILPFYPHSSDDGFSVMDYRAVDPTLGSWDDVAALGADHPLMFDLVLNHASRKGQWFANYLAGVNPGRHYFLEVAPDTDLRAVVRPRSTPLLAEVATARGTRHLWATFSEDQIDLDFANPAVLEEFVDIIFEYVARGARLLRLDAVAFIWKELGGPCIHLPQTHRLIKFLRALLAHYAPGVQLITETNVPHAENIAYLIDGDEAHVAYQFALPPLIADAMLAGNAEALTHWARDLPALAPGCHFLNFTASHDGIGLRAVESILAPAAIERLVATVRARGGFVSTRVLADGSHKPYELNVSYYDLLAGRAHAPAEPDTPLHIARFVCSQAIAMALAGIPALYFHSLTATHNDLSRVEESGRYRTINRRKWALDELDAQLDSDTHHARVFSRLIDLLELRARQPALHPDAAQTVLDLGPHLFAVRRHGFGQTLLALHNVTDQPVRVDAAQTPALAGRPHNVLTARPVDGPADALLLAPYEVAWLVC